MKSKKVILDTNLWISFLISGNFNEIDKLLEEKRITLIFSDELLEEFIEVIQRPKFEKSFSRRDIQQLLNTFDQFGKLVPVTSTVAICRDEKDNFLLNLALDGKANFLVTGDKDLLVIEKIKKTRILTFRDFVDRI